MTSLHQRTPQDVATGEGHEDIAEYLKKAVSVYMRLYCLKLISTAESVHINRQGGCFRANSVVILS